MLEDDVSRVRRRRQRVRRECFEVDKVDRDKLIRRRTWRSLTESVEHGLERLKQLQDKFETSHRGLEANLEDMQQGFEHLKELYEKLKGKLWRKFYEWLLSLLSFLLIALSRASLIVPVWRKRLKGVSVCAPWTIPVTLLVLWSVVWMFRGPLDDTTGKYHVSQLKT